MKSMIAHRSLLLFCASLLTLSGLATGCRTETTSATASGTSRSLASEQAPTEVSFGYIHHFGPGADEPGADNQAAPREVEFAEGAQLRLDDLVLVTSAVELHRCAPTNELSHLLQKLLLPLAHAHVPSSATRQGTPYVEDLLRPAGAARMVGGIAPPPGDYCELHVLLTPADDDAINLSSVAPEEIEHHTAMARGHWRPGPDQPWQQFSWTSDLRRVAVLPLYHPQSGDSPLRLLATDSDVLLLLDKEFPLSISELVSLDQEKGPDFGPFFNALIDSFSIYRYP